MIGTAESRAGSIRPRPPKAEGMEPGMEQRKDASEFTKAANAKLLEELPFEDQRDFEEATRGMIAPLSTEAVVDKSGRPIWDPSVFAFIEEGSPAPDTVNPSLWR